MKKRLLTLIVAVVMAALSAFAFIGCGNDDAPSQPKDTFYTGTLSAQSYASADSAAIAFLENEIAGDATNAVFGAYAKTADLNENEIEALNLTAEQKAQLTSAEKGTITYTDVTTDTNVLTSASKNKTVKLYILKFGSEYNYYAPTLNSGDVLTKSYFDEVFDPDKYVNYTFNSTVTTKVTASASGFTSSQTTTITMQIKFTEQYLHATVTMPNPGSYYDPSAPATITAEMFFVLGTDGLDGEVDVYLKLDGEDWEQIAAEDVEDYGLSASDLTCTPENDYSFFVKTPSGFKVDSDKLDLYIADIVEEMLPMLEGMSGGTPTITASGEYNVYDGKLSNCKAVVTAKMTMSMDGVSVSTTITATNAATYSDYGTTVVTVPQDLEL